MNRSKRISVRKPHAADADRTLFLLRNGIHRNPKEEIALGLHDDRLIPGNRMHEKHLVPVGKGESAQTEVKGKPVMLNRLHVAGRDTKGTKK